MRIQFHNPLHTERSSYHEIRNGQLLAESNINLLKSYLNVNLKKLHFTVEWLHSFVCLQVFFSLGNVILLEPPWLFLFTSAFIDATEVHQTLLEVPRPTGTLLEFQEEAKQ